MSTLLGCCHQVFLSAVILLQRKEEKEIALYGKVLSSDNNDGAGLENEDNGDDGEDMENDEPLSGEYLN